ncbi:hypothetical protein N7474_003786 [Penicillium riverlandense]|uniref:uncharacterized protein n=1 Tax=Penicillium riverlandense TaxID=1903569 RepID=UPI002546E149|nr:uncharacterized protein N7474_003786 [Penicillium riverlandense]KAJ5818195.1 hypothetical protein N7474_003786 [Penicillium riverlandense]
MVVIPNAVTAASQSTDSGDDVTEKEQAAKTIQRIYRGYRTRRELNGLGLSANARWTEVLKDIHWTQLHDPKKSDDISNSSEKGNETPEARQKWYRAVSVAMQAGSNNDNNNNNSSKSAKDHNPDDQPVSRHDILPIQTSKQMDLQYFLEMVDLKHRHGSNLRAYHAEWKKCPTTQNFFYWLDYGDGRDINLEKRPRERLEREQVRYLSREERRKYLVSVDRAGLLRWAKNGELVTTDGNRFRDSLEGVVPVDDPAPRFMGNERAETSSDSSSASAEAESQDVTGAKHTSGKQGEKKLRSKLAHPAAILSHLVGKPSTTEEWIFVADTAFRLYIGIKDSGTFQHSSFLRGGRISAAGTIKVHEGQLRSLKPLSGHYQPAAANFRAFSHALQNQGVDMSRVSMSKSYAMLAGIAGYSRTRRKVRGLQDTVQKQGQGQEVEGRGGHGS